VITAVGTVIEAITDLKAARIGAIEVTDVTEVHVITDAGVIDTIDDGTEDLIAVITGAGIRVTGIIHDIVIGVIVDIADIDTGKSGAVMVIDIIADTGVADTIIPITAATIAIRTTADTTTIQAIQDTSIIMETAIQSASVSSSKLLGFSFLRRPNSCIPAVVRRPETVLKPNSNILIKKPGIDNSMSGFFIHIN
jgi:hypothetical protein